MNFIDLQQYTISEEKSEEFLQEQGILQLFEHYPYCGNIRICRVRRGKYKCTDVGKNGDRDEEVSLKD